MKPETIQTKPLQTAAERALASTAPPPPTNDPAERIAHLEAEADAARERAEEAKEELKAKRARLADLASFVARAEKELADARVLGKQAAQRDAELINVDVDEAAMTPAQKRERAEHNRRRAEAVRTATIRAKNGITDTRANNADGPGGSVIHDATPGGDPIPAHLPGHGDIPDVPELPDLKSPSFDDLFNLPHPEMPQANNSASSGSPDVVAAINELKEAISFKEEA